jgi:hypothetical protein
MGHPDSLGFGKAKGATDGCAFKKNALKFRVSNQSIMKCMVLKNYSA